MSRLYPAEFVFPGHPDKLCDAIADTLVQEAIRRDPRALVGVEVAVHRSRVFVTGRIAGQHAETIDIAKAAREVYDSAGYDELWQPEPEALVIANDVCVGPLADGEAEARELADDQAICIGYANDIAQTNHLPVEHWLAGKLARRLYGLRTAAPELGLRPDGKVLVVIREGDDGWALDSFSCSLQQRTSGNDVALHRAVRLAVEDELGQLANRLPGFSPVLPDQLTVNGAGAFEVGGPHGDNGLSGKKLVMDAYGPRVPIGGGAWSGKDFFKADRAGGIHARRLAKAVVQLGLAAEATVTLGWLPGGSEARVLAIATPEGTLVSSEKLGRCVDLTLLHSGERFPTEDLVELARWGHFGPPYQPWERALRL
jgi:S-adenosylmethionine synthetase